MARIAFDLDETLGVPIIDGGTMIGFQTRTGCFELLERLHREHTLILWTVSNRAYATKALACGLSKFFDEIYTWDEIPTTWKDVRQLRVDLLIDDSEHHVKKAEQAGISNRYVLIPAYGSTADTADATWWSRQVQARIDGLTLEETP